MNKSTTNPVPFMAYPLSTDWNPENGVFGYVSGLRYGSLNTNTSPYSVTDKGAVSTSHGAQRTTSAVTLNQVAWGYGDKDLGNI